MGDDPLGLFSVPKAVKDASLRPPAHGSVEPTANGERKPDEQHFDPSRRIIKRKALIKELAAAYHAECVACCKELLQLQRKWEEEQYVEFKMADEAPRTLTVKSSKRRKR